MRDREQHNKQNLERYHWLKEHHICVSCGHREAFGKLVKEKMMPKKKMKVWEIVLLALGSPIWLTLLIAVFAVVFSIYVVLWSVIIVLWAVFAALAVCVPACAAIGVMYCVRGDRLSGFTLIGAGI